jgi:hypothetical protein
MTSGHPDGEPESLGLTVCRLLFDPAAGRFRHRGRTGIGIRAALFVELVLDGRLTGAQCPQAVGSGTTGDRLSDSLHRAVASRRPVRWKRWYGHVHADLAAAAEELQRLGTWHRDSGTGRLIDTRADLAATQARRVGELLGISTQARQTVQPGGMPVLPDLGLDEAALVLLGVGGGVSGSRPRPRAALAELDLLLPPDQATGRWRGRSASEPPSERTVVRAAVRAALEAMRARAGSRFLSG